MEPWVESVKRLDGVRVVKAICNMDLTIVALDEGLRVVGVSGIYNVYFHPDNIQRAREIYGIHGHGIHEGAIAAPIFNFIPDDSLRYVDAWALEANCVRFESDGA